MLAQAAPQYCVPGTTTYAWAGPSRDFSDRGWRILAHPVNPILKFVGTMDFSSFKMHFEQAPKLNKLTYEEAANHLACTLIKEAENCLLEVSCIIEELDNL